MKPVKSDVPYREIQAHFGKTAPAGTSTTQLATTEFAAAAAAAAVAAIPSPIMTHLITTSTQALAAGSTTKITGLNATITPSTTAKRVKIYIRWGGECPLPQDQSFGIQRGTTQIGNPDAAGLRPLGIANAATSFGGGANDSTTPEHVSYTFIDSPATTSAITYSATIRIDAAKTLYNQRTVDDGDGADRERMTSTIILEEIN